MSRINRRGVLVPSLLFPSRAKTSFANFNSGDDACPRSIHAQAVSVIIINLRFGITTTLNIRDRETEDLPFLRLSRRHDGDAIPGKI